MTNTMLTVPPAGSAVEVHAQRLRADRAEKVLLYRDQQLAQLLGLADEWETTNGGRVLDADTIVAAIRDIIAP